MGGSRAAVFLSFLVLQPGMLFLTSHLTPHTPPQPTFLFPPLLLIAHTARRSAFPAPAYYHRGGYDTLFCFCFFFFFFFLFLYFPVFIELVVRSCPLHTVAFTQMLLLFCRTYIFISILYIRSVVLKGGGGLETQEGGRKEMGER